MSNTQKQELIKAFNLFVTIFNKWLEKQATYDEWIEEKHKRDKNGRFAKKGSNNSATLSETDKEIEEKINQLKNIDWNKDNILPSLSNLIIKKYGLKNKPILLKKTIIDRNKEEHGDITTDNAVRILSNALYKTEAVLKGKAKRPNYYNFITRIDDEHNDLVTVELSEEKEYYEIVHFFVIRNRTRRKYERDNEELK